MRGLRRLLRGEGEAEAHGVPLPTEYKGHRSLRRPVSEGYQIIASWEVGEPVGRSGRVSRHCALWGVSVGVDEV